MHQPINQGSKVPISCMYTGSGNTYKAVFCVNVEICEQMFVSCDHRIDCVNNVLGIKRRSVL